MALAPFLFKMFLPDAHPEGGRKGAWESCRGSLPSSLPLPQAHPLGSTMASPPEPAPPPLHQESKVSLMELLACAAQTESVCFPPFHMCHLSLLERDCWVGRKAASVRSSTTEIQIFAFSGPQHSPERPRQPHPLHRRQCPRWVSRGRTRWWGGERVVESTSGPSLTTSCVTGGVAFTSFCLGKARDKTVALQS